MKINIAKCLLELLLERGDVTIPGLGKFQMNSQSASFGAGRKSLLPPSKSFSFTEEHDRNDDAFRNYLTEVEGIDATQAEKFVSKFSSNVIEGLNAMKPVELAYVGILKKEGGRGKIEFLQNSLTLAKINNLLPEVTLPDPQAVGDRPKMEEPGPKTVPAKATVPEKKPATVKPAEKKSVKQPIDQTAAPKPKHEEPKERGCWPWILAALLIGALLVLGIKMCSNGKEDVYLTNDHDAVATEEGGNTEAIPGDEITAEDAIAYNAEDEKREIETGNTNSENGTGIAGGTNMPQDCIVIIASMQNQRNISRLKKKVIELNYELYSEAHGAYTRVGMRVDCDALPSSYEDYILKVSNDFNVTAWSLSPEFPQ